MTPEWPNWIYLTPEHACASPFNPRHLRDSISQTGKAMSTAGPGQDRSVPLGITSEPPTGLDCTTWQCQHTYRNSPRNPNKPLTSTLGNRGDRSLCSQTQAVWHCHRRESGHLPEPGRYVTSWSSLYPVLNPPHWVRPPALELSIMEGLFKVMEDIKTIVIKDIKTVLWAMLAMSGLGESMEFTPVVL